MDEYSTSLFAYARKFDLALPSPLMNAAGMLGFAPDPHGAVAVNGFGAFVTNPISLGARTPANGQRLADFAGGFLLHTGYPNPGFYPVLREQARRWAHSEIGVIVHLLVRGPQDTAEMVQRLEGLAGVIGIELGLDTDVDAAAVRAIVGAAVRVELPVIARLPLERASALGCEALEAGAAAISLAPPRGLLPDASGSLVRGRLYGPALFPQALSVTQALAAQDALVIGGGGVYSADDVRAMLAVGAMGVQVDAALWCSDFSAKFQMPAL
jgi:dihydroorotate dehydrogenase (NAD+) catalytic subunit